MKDRGLVKTVGFDKPTYVGDPINAVRIFNEKEVDELIVADIDATSEGREPDYKMIENLAAECRMPLCYGGGVNTVEQMHRIVGLGVEKVALGAAVFEKPDLIAQAADEIGSQSVVAVLDIRKKRKGYEVFVRNGTRSTGESPFEAAQRIQECGAGELLINSIDRDGEMKGYDVDLAGDLHKLVSIPFTFLGGAGSLDHMRELLTRCGLIGAAAGSLFVFKGQYRAVLINYPSRADKAGLFDAVGAN